MRPLLLAVLLVPTLAHGSEPPRRLLPELCEAERRPAVTSLAIPASVRASAPPADPPVRRRSRSRAAEWLLLAAAAAAASALAIAASR